MILLFAVALQAATIGDWQHDLDAIVQKIEAVHPNAFTKTARLTFLREAAALRESVATLTEEQRMVRAMRLVASIHDGHTQLEPNSAAFALWYPIRIYEFSDGYFVTSAHKSVGDLAGAQLLEIAGRPATEVIEAARDLFGADNALSRKEGLFPFHNAALMRGLGYAQPNGELHVKVRLRGGAIADRMLTPQPAENSTFEWRFRAEMAGLPFGTFDDWIAPYKGLPYIAFRTADTSRPPHFTLRRAYLTRALPASDAYYVMINQVGDDMVSMIKNALSEVDRQKPRRLIIDLRYNFGGDGSRVLPFIHEFIKREDAPPWRELYVLSGRKTFSAGVMLLAAFIEHTQCTIIGEPAGAGFNSYGDATSVDDPRIGAHMYVSTLWHQLARSIDTSEYIDVDVPAVFSFADWSEGRDPAVDPILRGDEMRSIGRIALTDGAAAARKAWEHRRRRFAQVPWWSPPAEIGMRNVCNQLVEEKRFDDAVGFCALATEIRPSVWNTWMGLARAQRAAGRGQEALKSYERILEIDPMNFNGDDIRALATKAKVVVKPDVIRWGATAAATESAVAPLCKSVNVRRIDPPFLDAVRDKQMQIDCEGFLFAEKPRHAEFVFRDDSLEMVWIMTTREEESALLEEMRAAYGTPSHTTEKYIAFTNYNTALRRDKAEVLFYSDKLAPAFLPDFEK